MKSKFAFPIFHLAFFILPAAAFTFSGRLTDAQGTAYSGELPSVKFSIYDDIGGTNRLWSQTFAPLALGEDGAFSVELETAASTMYVGVKIGENAEIRPLTKVNPAAWTMFAAKAEGAKGDFLADYGFGADSLEVNSAQVKTLSANDAKEVKINSSVSIAGELRSGGRVSVSGGATIAGTVSSTYTYNIIDGKLELSGGVETDQVDYNEINGVKQLDVDSEFKVNGIDVTLPVGTIIMWESATIPDGWKICNGRDGDTPDLSGLFVRGIEDANEYGLTGGEKEVALTLGTMPSHAHRMNFKSAGYEHILYAYDEQWTWQDTGGIISSANKYNYTVEASGGNDQDVADAHENRPPYYALYYIMKVK